MVTTLLTIALLHWLALIVPGANVLLISQLAASGHRVSACYASIGISVVAVAWALLAILGVNSLFALHPNLRLAVQIAGGIYLCYLAYRLWRAGSPMEALRSGDLATWKAFRLGVLTNITNPKTALFFGSVFAAALPGEPEPLLLVAAVVLVFVNALACHVALSLLLSHGWIQAGYAKQRQLLNRVCACLIGAYGLRFIAATLSESGSR